MFIWLCVGLVQMFVSRDFMHAFVPTMRSDPWRGVTSLASEPSFYGYMCFFFFLIARDFKENRILFMILQIIQAVLLAQASVSIIYFAIFFVFYGFHMMNGLSSKRLLIISAVVVLGIIGLSFVMKGNSYFRIVFLIQSLLNGDTSLWSTDVSLFLRLGAVLKSFSRLGIPSPIGADNLVIMSGLGSAFYEMGIFSISLNSIIWKRIWNAYPKGERWIITWTVMACMCSAIQLSSPIFAFFLGYCRLKSIQKRESISTDTFYYPTEQSLFSGN